jgi:uncharacterized protein
VPRPSRSKSAWAVALEWHHVLFLHWPVDPVALRPLDRSPLEIETIDGRAFITVVAFEARRIRVGGLPVPSFLSSFPQLNLRTYVTLGGRPGVFLLRVAVGGRIAAAIGRRLFFLPYERARLTLRREGESHVFDCRSLPAAQTVSFAARYRPEGPVFEAPSGPLERWLSERSRYYSRDPRGRVVVGDIDHPPWSLQRARLESLEDTWPAAPGMDMPGVPALALYSPRQEAIARLPERIDPSLQNRASIGRRGSN